MGLTLLVPLDSSVTLLDPNGGRKGYIKWSTGVVDSLECMRQDTVGPFHGMSDGRSQGFSGPLGNR